MFSHLCYRSVSVMWCVFHSAEDFGAKISIKWSLHSTQHTRNNILFWGAVVGVACGYRKAAAVSPLNLLMCRKMTRGSVSALMMITCRHLRGHHISTRVNTGWEIFGQRFGCNPLHHFQRMSFYSHCRVQRLVFSSSWWIFSVICRFWFKHKYIKNDLVLFQK